MQSLRTYLENPKLVFIILLMKTNWLFGDETYLKMQFRLHIGKKLNLRNPTLYQEKLQWLKIHNKKHDFVRMVDKITAKEYAASIIGSQYIIPTLGIWKCFDEIDFDELPNQFVLKTNNGGGNAGVVICKDKSLFDKKMAKKQLERSMKLNIYRFYREWPYKAVKPCIFAERYMSDDFEFNHCGLTDYKFTCFNGIVDNVMVCLDRHLEDTKFYFFDKNWNLLPLNVRGKETSPSFKLPRPDCIDEMFEIAGKLSKGIPFLRVDLYCIGGMPYFGETTFYPASGFDSNILPETEKYFGDKIILPLN